ncbi:MAG: AMP-binding protein [Streptosporangiaceae bacterium]|nr:AMP-binding protein [Streptosporangiaceae bacterium]MBV9855452.1 AMP-binding protein [Streptosporangiaceae bacterium]
MAPHRMTVGDIISEHRRSYPGKLALVDRDYRLTWPQLDERVSRLANALRTAGVGQGDRILWLGQNSFRVYELLGAAAKIGAMVCPGYWRWAPPEMAFAIDDFSPKVVIWQEEEIGGIVHAARAVSQAAEAALWLRHDSGPQNSAGSGGDDLPSTPRRGASSANYEAFLASGGPADPGLDIDPDSALLVIYTAAISGRPCGSMLSHTNLISMGLSVAWLGDIDDTTVFLNSGPMFHIGNFQFFGIPVLMQGGTNLIARRVIASELLDIMAAEKCTRAYLMPATIRELVTLMRERGVELPHLRATIAAPLWQGMVAADESRHCREGGGMGYGYGQTEVTGMPIVGGYGGKGSGNAGRPTPVTAVRILDADGRECPVGEAGEICVRGDTVHLGYWNRPEINCRRFRGGWWHTTDLGRREPDGTISFLGTMTRMIKSGAENIFPVEVENCLESHPAVKEAAVIGIPSERFLQDVKAVAVLNGTVPATADTAAELIEHCRRNIASYKKPKTVEFLDALPRVQGAKDYAALDEKFGGGGYPGGGNLGAGH